MKSKIKLHIKPSTRIAFISIAFISALFLLICYPQAYYFNDKIEYKNFHVYYDKKIPDQIYGILNTVDQAIRKSEFYDDSLKFKIFLRSDDSKYNTFPLQFPSAGTAQAIPIIKNIFFYKVDCETNTSYSHSGHERTFSSVLAHELTHVLVENKNLFKSRMAFFDKNSLSEFGLWKEEGYAEYIAGGPSIGLDEGLKIFNNTSSLEYAPHIEYFKYWFAVRHLILNKNMTFKEILNSTLKLADVLDEAQNANLDFLKEPASL